MNKIRGIPKNDKRGLYPVDQQISKNKRGTIENESTVVKNIFKKLTQIKIRCFV